MPDNRIGLPLAAVLDEEGDGDALADVEDVLVEASVGAGLFLERVAVQVEDVNLVEGAHQALAHAPEGRVVQVGVVGDHPNDAASGLFDLPLGEAQELHVVVLEPVLLLAKLLSVHLLVVLDHTGDPLARVGRDGPNTADCRGSREWGSAS